MVTLSGTFSRIKKYKVLVIGDLMLDLYTMGSVRRISPEAPVTILNVEKEENRPGGAANVAINLRALGGEVSIMGRVGPDYAGRLLIELLQNEGISTKAILSQGGLPTPVKNRLVASNQQLIRVDNERIAPLETSLEEQQIAQLPQLLEDVQVVAISDYAKGFLSKRLLGAIIDQAKERGIPVLVDPKKGSYERYLGATLIKPNLFEAREASGLDNTASLSSVAEVLLEKSQAEYLAITRSAEGISVFSKDGIQEDFPVHVREVKDVTGAGDTVLATLTCALANGLSISESMYLANVAAGLSLEHLGCARINLSDLARRLLSIDTVNKVFDEQHLFALQQALKGRHYAVLGLNCVDGLNTQVFKSIRQLSQDKDKDLLIYIQDDTETVDPSFVSALSSLNEVSFIILKGDSLRSLTQQIYPEETYVIEENMLKKLEQTTALLV